jgi:hypothetical protein
MEDAARSPSSDSESPNAAPVSAAAGNAELVRFAFRPEPELRPAFDTIFHELAQRRRGAPELSEATLYRFAIDSATQRYVLLARLVPSERASLGQWGWAFIAIERESADWHLSRAYDFKADDYLTVVGMDDIDADGSADVIYCVWYEGQDEVVPARGLGYRNGHWYAVDPESPGPSSARRTSGRDARKRHGRVNQDCREPRGAAPTAVEGAS